MLQAILWFYLFAMNIIIEADRVVESSMRILPIKCGEVAINLDVGGDEMLKY